MYIIATFEFEVWRYANFVISDKNININGQNSAKLAYKIWHKNFQVLRVITF